MPFSLVRIDDRLIHGQVVVGWVHAMRPDRIILCNDEVATSDWEKELYLNSYTDTDVEIDIWTMDETLAYLRSPEFLKEKVILLVESPKDAWNLVERGAPITEINVGGMHYKENAREITSYVFVSQDDINYFKRLHEKGIKIEARDVPNAKSQDLIERLDKVGKK
ncbi:MAG: PTS sugar transporter subunit IIB [Calditrichaeota bacterium]|nr:PTS sugar transporter subunit IIB [Calditrichota bacterium]